MSTVNTTIYEYYCLYENICAQSPSSCLEPRRYQFAGNILWRRWRRSPKGIVTLIRCFNNYTIIVRLSVVLGFFSPKTCITKALGRQTPWAKFDRFFIWSNRELAHKDALAEIRFCLSLMSNRSKVVFGCLKWSGKSLQNEIQCAFLFHPPPISNASW